MNNISTGTSIWNLCRKGITFFTKQLFKIPGNNNNTFLWEDKINGNPPLFSVQAIDELKYWLVSKHIMRLADISTWDRKGNWLEWKFPDFPDRRVSSLHGQLNLLINLLFGNAPIHSSCRDAWGWGPTGSYSAAIGYNAILNYPPSTHNAKFWKHVWQSPSIPKVNFFTWILMHQ